MTGGGKLSSDELAVVVCEKMGWTFEEYLDQPDWFMQFLILKWEAEAEYARIKEKETKL